ncbi:MAG: DUF3488 domain-containing protein [Acidobacteriia bacterium]|nr:DUF3488 domain-containing protein [Terriglobia bacterium]
MYFTAVDRFFQFCLLGLVTSGYLAVAGSGYLDAPTLVLTGAGLLLRGLLIAGVVRFEVAESTASILSLSYIGFFVIDYFFLSRDFLTATVHMVFFLAITRILTARSARDYLFTAVIAFMELLAAAITSVEFNFVLFLGLFLLFAIGALSSGEIRRSLVRSETMPRGFPFKFHARLGLISVLATLGILLITGGLFFLLPRTAEAAFARLISQRTYLLPGFSNQVTLGQIGEIKTTSRPVMHIAIYSRSTLPAIKWRGAALTQFDGKQWSTPNPGEEKIPVWNGHVELTTAGAGRRLNYHVQLSAADTDALFFAGTPLRLDVNQFQVIRNRTGSYKLPRVPPPGFAYDAYSLLDVPPETAPPTVPAPQLAPETRREALQLPKLDPRIAQLARAFSAGASTDLERARALERRLRRDYGYSLELPSREVADPLADFLFVRRKGYCEHFASAMAIMLRTLGIPARLATGFQNGIYNPFSELWVVRASDAHSWVEAWIPRHGWSTFDPTPPDPNPPGFALFSKLELYVDAAQTFWQDWVVSYDMRRQGTLSYRMESGARRLGIHWFDSLTDLGTDWPARATAQLKRASVWFIVGLLMLAASFWMLAPR